MSLPTSYSWILSVTSGSGVVPASGGSEGNRASGQGKSGFAVPFSADGRGRLSRVSGDTQLRKLIMLNLSDLDSANPFQEVDLGLGADMVFAVGSDKLRAEVRRRINVLFRRLQLQDRARLDGSPQFTSDSQNQELTVDINYINLEEDRPGNLGLKFSLVNSTVA